MLTLSDKTIQVLVVGALNIQAATADVIDSLVINHKAAVRVFESSVCSQNGVVRFDHRCGNLGSGIDTEFQFALLAIVHRETLHKKSTKARSSSTTK